MNGRLKGMLPYAALVLGAAFLYHETGSFANAGRPGQLGPDFWPRAVLVLLMIVCGVEMVRRALAARQAPPAAGAKSKPHEDEETRYPRLLAGGIAITVAYVPGIEYLGFFVATALYLAAFMLIGRYRRAGIIAAASIGGSLAFVYVFMKIVYVSLPLGVGPLRQVSTALLAVLGIH
jgi:putative tricarboxylic transport membrane protein